MCYFFLCLIVISWYFIVLFHFRDDFILFSSLHKFPEREAENFTQ